MTKPISYAKNNPFVLNVEDRLQIASQILHVLRNHLGKSEFANFKVLDIGCSGGIMANFFAESFKQITGIDSDSFAVYKARKNFKKKNLKFYVMNAEETNFKDNSFDLLICNQVYQCVDKPEKLLEEIFRILKPGGICFFSGTNKLWYFSNKHLIFWQLKSLVKKFLVYPYTAKVLYQPGKYGFKKLEPFEKITNILPESFWQILEPFSQNFIWILEKPSR